MTRVFRAAGCQAFAPIACSIGCIGTSDAAHSMATYSNTTTQPLTVTFALAPSDTSSTNIFIATSYQMTPIP